MSRRRLPEVHQRRHRRCRGDPKTRTTWILRSDPDPANDPGATRRRRRCRWLARTRGHRLTGWAEAAPGIRYAGKVITFTTE